MFNIFNYNNIIFYIIIFYIFKKIKRFQKNPERYFKKILSKIYDTLAYFSINFV